MHFFVCLFAFSYEINYIFFHLINKNDILETCHTNIHSLGVIKNSIIKHFKLSKSNQVRVEKNRNSSSKKASSTIEAVVTFGDSDKIDYYLFKIEDTIKKWETMQQTVQDDQMSTSSLAKIASELKPLRERVEFVGNLTRAESLPLSSSSDFESAEALRKKIEKLEDESLSFVTVLNQLNEYKNEFGKIKEKQPTDEQQMSEDKQLELEIVSVGNEIGAVEELYKTASVE